jgi:hypothetical protein
VLQVVVAFAASVIVAAPPAGADPLPAATDALATLATLEIKGRAPKTG